ncbi:hypothetical protein B484DRAFT_393722, partial [Ochromonadaceae sp. CCMP2298]
SVDPLLLQLLSAGWHQDPALRPPAALFVEGLTSTLLETEFVVDACKIREENVKLTLLAGGAGMSAGGGGGTLGGSVGFRGSTIMMAASLLGAKPSFLGGGAGGAGTVAGSPPTPTPYPHTRPPPSSHVIDSLLRMRLEPAWGRLEEEGAFLVLTPQRPFFMLWATKRWTQLTGYLVNDLIAYEVFALLGPKTDLGMIDRVLGSGSRGRSEHVMSTIYRRDGKPLPLSVHVFPVFDSNSSSPTPLSSSAAVAPATSAPASLLSETEVDGVGGEGGIGEEREGREGRESRNRSASRGKSQSPSRNQSRSQGSGSGGSGGSGSGSGNLGALGALGGMEGGSLDLGSVEAECAGKRVAYLVVQFGSIRDREG